MANNDQALDAIAIEDKSGGTQYIDRLANQETVDVGIATTRPANQKDTAS